MKNLTLVHKRHPEYKKQNQKYGRVHGSFRIYLSETLKDLLENSKQIDLKPEQGTAIKSLVHGQDVLATLPTGFDVNKIDRPNTTPTVRAICTFAVYFSVFRPFCCFTLVDEGHFVLCYKEKTRAIRSCEGKF